MARALVIGSQTQGLTGPNLDAERVEAYLLKQHFIVDRRVNERATRAGILEGFEKLIAEVTADEPVVVYYSGHGARAEDPTPPPPGIDANATRYLQAIVPVDYEQSTENDFRGILAEELSILQFRLTRKTRNVAVFLDCCHAALMFRSRAVPRALKDPLRVGIAGARAVVAAQLEKYPGALDARDNPDAVRLVAARPELSAYELPGPDGRVSGLFTESLLAAFEEFRDRAVSYRSLGEWVRERVLGRYRHQRPEIEGPAERQVFRMEPPPPEPLWFPIRKRGSDLFLPIGLAQGVRVGDEYAFMASGAVELDAKETIARATVSSGAAPTEARLDVVLPLSHTEVPDGAIAFQVGWAIPRRPVAVEAEGAQLDLILGELARLPLVEVTRAASSTVPPLASWRVHDGTMELRNRLGQLAVVPSPLSTATVRRYAENVAKMVHAQGVREIDGSPIDGVADEDLVVEWGLVEHGKAVPMPPAGGVICEQDGLYIRVQNQSTKSLYVSILDVGLAEGVDVFSRPETSGVLLSPGKALVMHRDRLSGVLQPIPFTWPEYVPRDGLRSEELIVFATTTPCDLSTLSREGMRSAGGNRLARLLSQSRSSPTRGALRRRSGDDGFVVKRMAFEASPWPIQRGAAAFLVDDRRSISDLVAPAGEGVAPPGKLALRLTDVVIHTNRALFRAEVRVDVLVVTRRPQGAAAPYRAETLRFPGVKDGHRLPLDNVLVYHGPAQDFVDVCVWVSRDRTGTLPLADLLENESTSSEMQAALGPLLAPTAVASQAGAIVLSAGGAATLASIGYRLLSQATGESIGLYRTSLLAQERFGVGRHPKEGLMRAPDFSFGYEVLEVT